jgi:hypothetical protein
LFSPQIFSKSQNIETELKKERERKRKKRKSIEKRERKKRAPKVSHNKGMNIFREEKHLNFKSFCVSRFSLPLHLNPFSKLF